jgi:hypothetical protein
MVQGFGFSMKIWGFTLQAADSFRLECLTATTPLRCGRGGDARPNLNGGVVPCSPSPVDGAWSRDGVPPLEGQPGRSRAAGNHWKGGVPPLEGQPVEIQGGGRGLQDSKAGRTEARRDGRDRGHRRR